jgi:hypothetical protein
MSGGRVFVSYSQPDRAVALAVVQRLEAEGLGCWVAPRDVAPAADWAAEIVDAIAAARVMVLVFSASANASPQVRREVERAVHRDVTVLPFRIADVLPAHSLEYFLSSQHWLDAFPPPMEPHYQRLAAYLKNLLSQKQAPLTRAAQPPERPSFPPETLQQLEAQLARHIGPVARHLVAKVAAQAVSLEALIAQLGGEIDNEAERRRFLATARPTIRAR